MSELEERLGSILNNPQMMQQIMSLAQSMNASEQAPPPPSSNRQEPPPLPQVDSGQFKALAGLASQGVDQNQQALLKALRPYISKHRVEKLEKAMRASKMAAFATGLMQSGFLRNLAGR